MTSAAIVCCFLAISAHVSSATMFGGIRSHPMFKGKPLAKSVRHFKFNNCGNKTDTAHVNSLSVTPDPIRLPGNVTFAFDVDVNKTAVATIGMKVEMKVSLDGSTWTEVPCELDVGSCTYEDICGYLSGITECPEILKKHGIPCKCPFKQGKYTMPTTDLTIDEGIIPPGNYYIKANVYHNSEPGACAEVYLTFA